MDRKLCEVLKAVYEKTQRGTLAWQEFGSESFRAAIGGAYVHIQRSSVQTRNEAGDEIIALRFSTQVADERGRVVSEGEAVEGDEAADFQLLQQLFQAARTAAFGGYRVMDRILQVLQLTP